jgi:hypothetical protein
MTRPDRWVVLKIFSSSDGTFYRVLGSWYGGYLCGDSWRLNSGIERVEKTEDAFLFYGFSGSCYECGIDNYGMHLESSAIVNQMQKVREDITVEVLPQETDWLNLGI